MSPGLESYGDVGSGWGRFEIHALGTENALLLEGEDSTALGETAQEAFDTLESLERALSKFLPESDVSLLNLLGAGRPVRVGRHLLALLRLARQAWEVTGGAFDPTVGPLMKAWGLVDLEGRIPGEEEIQAILACRGMDHVAFDEAAGVAWFDRPGVSVDLGGIGKGYAIDTLAKRARERGIRSGAVISGRSSVAVWGAPPEGNAWRFEVVHPDDPEESLAVLEVEPGSVSSSGAYVRRFFRQGREYGHVLDPRTGKPARGVRSVTVWTQSALLGDVLSTAVFVAGNEALGEAGCARRLVEAWTPREETPRAGVLAAFEDPGVWGGLRLESFHIGEPAFRLIGS